MLPQMKTPGESRAVQCDFVALHFYFLMINALFFETPPTLKLRARPERQPIQILVTGANPKLQGFACTSYRLRARYNL
jgi:hypothetical protein